MEPTAPFSLYRSHILLCLLASMTVYATHALFAAHLTEKSILKDPEGTIVAQGFVSIRVGDLTLSGLDGSFFVEPSSEKLFIAGFTTPVVVEKSGQVVGLIPAGMQWTYTDAFAPDSLGFLEKLKRLPPRFFREQAVPVDPVFVHRFSAIEQRIALLEELRINPILWLLASYHPQTLAHVWISDSSASDVVQFLQTTLLPFADSGHPSVPSALFIDVWARRLDQEIWSQDNREEFFTEYVAILLPFLEQFADRGYVERTQWYSAALKELAHTHAPVILSSLDAIGIRKEVQQRVSDDVFVETETRPTLSSQELDTRLRILLRDAGGMFLTSTRFVANAAHSFEVHSIAFASGAGDSVVDFTYDAARHEVSDIIRDGKSYPHTVSWEQFVDWVKR